MSTVEERVPDVLGSVIVLVGDFNPRIFQPFWFAANELVTDAAAEDADAIVTADFSEVTFDWFAVQVFRERVTFSTVEATESPRRIRDLVVDVFSILHHTPIRVLGMNHQGHLWLREGEWERVARVLAPSESHVLDEQELASYTVAAPRKDDLEGSLRVTVEPSTRIRGGAWIAMNSHVDLGDTPAGSAKRAVAVIDEYWESSMSEAQSVMDTIRELAGA